MHEQTWLPDAETIHAISDLLGNLQPRRYWFILVIAAVWLISKIVFAAIDKKQESEKISTFWTIKDNSSKILEKVEKILNVLKQERKWWKK